MAILFTLLLTMSACATTTAPGAESTDAFLERALDAYNVGRPAPPVSTDNADRASVGV